MNAKWHIYRQDSKTGKISPLCWDGQVLEFNTKIQAQRFLNACITDSARTAQFYNGTFIAKGLLKHAERSIDGSHKIVRYNINTYEDYMEDCDNFL